MTSPTTEKPPTKMDLFLTLWSTDPRLPGWTRWLSLLGFFSFLMLLFSGGKGGRFLTATELTSSEDLWRSVVRLLLVSPSLDELLFLPMAIRLLKDESARVERFLGSSGYVLLFVLTGVGGNLGAALGLTEPVGLVAPFCAALWALAPMAIPRPAGAPRPHLTRALAWGLFLGLVAVSAVVYASDRTWMVGIIAATWVGAALVRFRRERGVTGEPTDTPDAAPAAG